MHDVRSKSPPWGYTSPSNSREIPDLTAPREAPLAKIWVRDAGFCRPFVGNSGNPHNANKRSIAAKAASVSFQTKL